MPIKPPICKTCGKAEWRHLCAGPPPTLQEIRDATAALERAFPSHPNPTPVSRKSPAPAKLPAVAAPLAAPPAVAPRTTIAELEALAAEASARIAAKPRKGKRVTEPKKPAAGRPKLHPDRKAYKAEKERERRAAAKAKAKP